MAAEIEESKTETENITDVDTKTEETAHPSEPQHIVEPETEDGDLEIMTAAPQSETEATDSVQQQTKEPTQQATDATVAETQPQKETYIELPFIPAE